MLVRLQFILRHDRHSTSVAWPRETKHQGLHFTHNPLESIGYGSEEVALEDSSRWLEQFPSIEAFEITTFVGDSK